MTRACVLSVAVASLCVIVPRAQEIDEDRERGVRMLREIRRELRRWHVDATFGGVDVDSHFRTFEEHLRTAGSQAQISGTLAQALVDLGDSHTFFIPPPLSYDVDYGFLMQMVGDRCLVVAVRPGSLAEADGLRAGDTVVAIEGLQPTRDNLWTISYALNTVRPRKALQVTVGSASGARTTRSVRARVGPAKPFQRFEDWAEALVRRLAERSRSAFMTQDVADLVIVKVASFDASDERIDEAMSQARGKRAVVLDLRENPGGSANALRRIGGYLFENVTEIGRVQRRKDVDPLRTSRRPADRVLRGDVIVLVDSASASAAEVLARSLQIARRARILGDRTAGAVMLSRIRTYRDGHEGRFLLYGLSISEGRLLMADGQSLEAVGVTPDEIVVPTAQDLAAGRDPVLARAAELLGVTLDPEAAAGLFPRVWPDLSR